MNKIYLFVAGLMTHLISSHRFCTIPIGIKFKCLKLGSKLPVLAWLLPNLNLSSTRLTATISQSDFSSNVCSVSSSKKMILFVEWPTPYPGPQNLCPNIASINFLGGGSFARFFPEKQKRGYGGKTGKAIGVQSPPLNLQSLPLKTGLNAH